MQALLAGNWQLFLSINEHAGQNSWLDRAMIFCANDLIFFLPFALVLWWLVFVSWSPLQRWRVDISAPECAMALRTVFLTIMAAVVAVAMNLTIEHFIREPRPFISHPQTDHVLIQHAADASFPSDHSAVAFALAGMLLLYWGMLVRRHVQGVQFAQQTVAALAAQGQRAVKQRYLFVGSIALLCLLIACVIGIARIFVGVHYPLDIVGGMGTGMLSAVGTTRIGQLLARPIDRLLVSARRFHLA